MNYAEYSIKYSLSDSEIINLSLLYFDRLLWILSGLYCWYIMPEEQIK